MNLVHNLWRDERGGLHSCELVFLAAILVIGIVPGVVVVRDALLHELSDFARAISAIDYHDHDHHPGRGRGHHRHGRGRGVGHGHHDHGIRIETADQAFAGNEGG